MPPLLLAAWLTDLRAVLPGWLVCWPAVVWGKVDLVQKSAGKCGQPPILLAAWLTCVPAGSGVGRGSGASAGAGKQCCCIGVGRHAACWPLHSSKGC